MQPNSDPAAAYAFTNACIYRLKMKTHTMERWSTLRLLQSGVARLGRAVRAARHDRDLVARCEQVSIFRAPADAHDGAHGDAPFHA